MVRDGLVLAGLEPASTGSQRLGACALMTLALTHVLTARLSGITVPASEKTGVVCVILHKNQQLLKCLHCCTAPCTPECPQHNHSAHYSSVKFGKSDNKVKNGVFL